MNSIRQYTDLYHQYADVFALDAPKTMNDRRSEALAALTDARLPHKGDEGYEKTSLNDIFAPDFGINVNRVNATADIAQAFRCDVPNMSTLLAVNVNDTFHISPNVETRLPQGVIFTSLRKAALSIPEVIAHHYGTIANINRPEVALNTLLAQDGTMLYIPDGVTLEKPLQLVNILASTTPVMAVRRLLIVLGKNAHAQLLACDHTQPGCADALASQVIEIILDEGASLDYYDIEESSPATARVSSLFATQQRQSRLLIDTITLTCGTTRNDFSIDILGEGTSTTLAGMAIASDDMHIDNSSNVAHKAPGCHSRQLFKYVLDDNATGAFEGSILVTPQAPYTEAYQSNKNILASPAARMHTRPQLEIYNDDVKCSHGAATGQLDSEALFYMRTRGIPEQLARTMLMQAFMTDIIDSVTMDGLRDRLRHLVERRFNNRGDNNCNDCQATSSCYKQ